ncbi:GNAT family N-acetyltransferase [Microbulbifer sp. DLAB2-AF]|uniref:GNAT family N-acetyltransferase n=1 Tax=Microbulbifer sp. DLAB2-AF TaxID=3243395 RepID=UPI004038FFE7
MELQLLAENKQALPIVAEWYFTEWGYLRESNSLAKTRESLSDYLNTDKIPLLVIAVDSGAILGAAQLKYCEMTIYPEKEHWLGGVYVSKSHRGKKIAEAIIDRIISLAEQLGVSKLYLQTEHLDGGLYSCLGWNPIEKVTYCGLEVLVMERELTV